MGRVGVIQLSLRTARRGSHRMPPCPLQGGLMDDTIDFDLAMPVPSADKKKQIKEDCRKIADLFDASATAMFEGQDGLIFHLEFDDAAKFGKFAEYLRSHGLLRVDRIQTKSDRVH